MQRGQSFEEALPVHQMDAGGVMVNAWRYLDAQGAPIDLIEVGSTAFSAKIIYMCRPKGKQAV